MVIIPMITIIIIGKNQSTIKSTAFITNPPV